jgi:hypothetical protein
MELKITTNFDDVLKGLDRQSKQTRFAMAVALTRTAQDVKKAEEEEMRRTFDSPTPYTLRSLFLKPATRANLEAMVWVKDDRAGSGTPATKYLLPQIEGGRRGIKGFEKALQQAGHMRKGYKAVPGQFARLDRFGNVSFGQIIQILSALRITLTAGHTRNQSFDAKKQARARQRQGGQIFALPDGRGKLPPGIYQRRDFSFGGAAPRPLFVFVSEVSYRKRFRFHDVAQRTVATKFQRHFDRAYAEALGTAR